MSPLEELWRINAAELRWFYHHPFYVLGALGLVIGAYVIFGLIFAVRRY